MKRERKEKHFVQKPVYPGGLKAMRAFIKENLKYPEEALKNKVEGSVHVRYTINYKGQVIKTSIVSSLGNGCDEEASRLVSLFKFEVAKQHKIKVKFYKNIKIHFKLPKAKKLSKVSYQYTTAKDSKSPKKQRAEKKSSGYNYTISW